MGKRIFRITAADAFFKKDILLNREISLVLNDGRVFQGYLRKTENQVFYCENLLKKSFQINEKDVKEVIYDELSTY